MNMQALNITTFGSIAVSLEVQVGILNVFFFCSCNLSTFPPRFQQSRIQALRKRFGQEGHTSPSPKLPVRLRLGLL